MFLNHFVLFQYLTSANLTTNEDIKGAYSSKRTHTNFNPFSAGSLFANCNDVLCSPLNPSLIDATGIVTAKYLAERKLSQLQNDLQQQQQQVPAAGQIGMLNPGVPYPRQPQPPQSGMNNPSDSQLPGIGQVTAPGINQVMEATADGGNFDNIEKVNCSSSEQSETDGML